MTFDDLVRGFATLPAENLNKFSFFSVMSQCKPRNATSAASNGSGSLLTTNSGLSPGESPAPALGRVPSGSQVTRSAFQVSRSRGGRYACRHPGIFYA